jgi:hypothetical protein
MRSTEAETEDEDEDEDEAAAGKYCVNSGLYF